MKWVLAETSADAAALSNQAGLHPLIARLMLNRGITEPDDALKFLGCDLSSLSDPRIFIGMDKAVARIKSALSKQERIAVYGDYDVDGVTGSALLYSVLKHLGAAVTCYIPDRMSEGYGLNKGALGKLKASGVTLVISVDCGISAISEADHARSLVLDLIITDHHQFIQQYPDKGIPGVVLPNAYVLLHPGLIDEAAPDRIRKDVSGLTGVGVAFKLAQAVLKVSADDKLLTPYLDLVALGTVADVGTITGENRILVKHGLDILSSPDCGQKPGIAALKLVAGLEGKKIGVGAVGFSLAPRINASGRLVQADIAFRLLTTDSPDDARQLAENLDAVNRERQAVEEVIQEEAKNICGTMDISVTGAFVLSSPDWHPGVIGIVASRIVDLFYRPTALICVKDGIGKGSARSIPGFDLHQGLASCADLLLGFGGHKYAAGFTIAEDKIPQFRERLGSIVMERMGPGGFTRTLCVDSAVVLDDLSLDFMHEIERMAPFGQGNPEPRLGARNLEVVSTRIVRNNHQKLQLRQQGGAVFGAIAFSRAGLVGKTMQPGSKIAAVFTPRINVWNGKSSVELEIRDMKTEK